jgi:hypothetical protein
MRKAKTLKSAQPLSDRALEERLKKGEEGYTAVVPFFYAVVFLQYLTELDRFPEHRNELALVIHQAIPRDVFKPLPLIVDVSVACGEALKQLGFYECFEVVKKRYHEELEREGLLA